MSGSIYCPHCHKHTQLSVGLSVIEHGGRSIEAPAVCKDIHHRSWWIGLCNACGQACLVLENGQRVYPQPLPSPTDIAIPDDIAKSLNEAKLCHSLGCYRACATMARLAVQIACHTKGALKGDLVGQISYLAESGVITKDLAEWATVVRWIGNDGAHPNALDVEPDDAEVCLHLAEQFLHVIFVTPARAKARREARGR